MDDNDRHRHQHHQHHHHHHSHEPHERFAPPPVCPVEHLSAAVQSLDTVRALHSTVVSLRSALEEAHREIDQLKKQIAIGVDIDSGKEFRRSQDNLDKIETDRTPTTRPTTESPKVPSARKSRRLSGNVQKHSAGSYSIRVLPEDIRIVSAATAAEGSTENQRKSKMASKIDVQIKVSSNFKPHKRGSDEVASAENTAGSSSEMITTESDSHADTDPASDVDTRAEGAAAVVVPLAPQNDDDEEGSADRRNVTPPKRTPSSEGENSVFEDANAKAQHGPIQTEPSEEVDDIELIFSADDKDFEQQQDDEDLVSITGDYEPWEKTGKSGTPVLVNFGSIGSDTDAGAGAVGGPVATGSGASMFDMGREDSYDSFYPVS